MYRKFIDEDSLDESSSISGKDIEETREELQVPLALLPRVAATGSFKFLQNSTQKALRKVDLPSDQPKLTRSGNEMLASEPKPVLPHFTSAHQIGGVNPSRVPRMQPTTVVQPLGDNSNLSELSFDFAEDSGISPSNEYSRNRQLDFEVNFIEEPDSSRCQPNGSAREQTDPTFNNWSYKDQHSQIPNSSPGQSCGMEVNDQISPLDSNKDCYDALYKNADFMRYVNSKTSSPDARSAYLSKSSYYRLRVPQVATQVGLPSQK